ncbi:hypothetical protein [uncultured Psychroserpens sp.]|uniref:hypothetical protein n=1 Tax=uncultured Psychroserpens sp. TaxID=255436 RepID=UPI0026275972|nr:hypothetical protein [uncultured Psychroserpens sp.]
MSKAQYAIKGFNYAMICVGLIVLFIILQSLTNSQVITIESYDIASGFCILLTFFFTISGFIYSIKGRKDPRSIKKIIGIILNSILITLLIATVVANIIDLVKLT